MKIRVTASVVTYQNDKEELRKCLNSLTINDVSLIYVIDNSPKDDLRELCSEFTNVDYTFNDKNLGYGAGHNVAIRRAMQLGVDYHLVINPDVSFGEHVIDRIMGYMDENEDVAQLIPNTVYPNGNLQYVCRLLPDPIVLFFRRFMPKKWTEKLNYRYCLEFNDHKQPMNVPYHMGSFMFFRMKCLEKVGLFDERFFMYPEDIDITRRMHKHYRTMFWPEVTIVHVHRSASYKSRKMLRIHLVNMIKYFNKWGWIFDKERRQWNRQLLEDLGYYKKE